MYNKKLPKTLYYYCSLNTFFNILTNKSIWLTEIAKSNDSMEQKFLAYEIMRNIETYIKYRCSDEMSQEDIVKLENAIYPKLCPNPTTPVWGMCLSKKRDNLSQWRGYSDDASGMCIGFNTEYLNSINGLCDLPSIPENNDCLRLRDVEYGDEAIENYFRFISKLAPRTPKRTTSSTLKEKLERDIKGIFMRPYYKHNAFRSEAEWRIVYTKSDCEKDYSFNFEYLNRILKKTGKFEILGRKYEIRNSMLQSHIEVKILDMLSAIDEIFIGPKSKVTIEELEAFIRFNYDEADINNFPNIFYSSAFSYR